MSVYLEYVKSELATPGWAYQSASTCFQPPPFFYSTWGWVMLSIQKVMLTAAFAETKALFVPSEWFLHVLRKSEYALHLSSSSATYLPPSLVCWLFLNYLLLCTLHLIHNNAKWFGYRAVHLDNERKAKFFCMPPVVVVTCVSVEDMATDSDEWKVCETYLSISTAFAGNYIQRGKETTCDVEVQVGLVGWWYTLLSLVHCVVWTGVPYRWCIAKRDVCDHIRRGKAWKTPSLRYKLIEFNCPSEQLVQYCSECRWMLWIFTIYSAMRVGERLYLSITRKLFLKGGIRKEY